MKFTPRGTILHVKLNRRPDRRPSGLWLPQSYHQKATEATVLATGPGTYLPATGATYPIWIMEGDTVLFPEHEFHALGDDGEGWVAEEHVPATVDPFDGTIYPEADWLLLAPDAAPAASAGGIALPEPGRKLPGSGLIVEAGPGELRQRGVFAGLRISVRTLLSLADDEALLERRAWWAPEATVVWAAERVLVRARDLLLLADTPHATGGPEGKSGARCATVA